MEGRLYITAKDIVERMFQEASPKFFDELYKGEFGFEGRHTEVFVNIQKEIFVIYSYIPGFSVTGKDPIRRLLKFMTKVNEFLYTGNLEYNFETGEVRYKTSQIMLRIQNPASVIQFLLEQHQENFSKLSEKLKMLIDPQSDPVKLAAMCLPLS
jgi:hypothetical protein